MMNQQKIITDKSLILKNNETKKYVISVDPNDESQNMEIWVRDITFLDIQAAAQRMIAVDNGEVSLDLEAYWNFAFTNWITKTNPSLSQDELKSIKGYVGEQISKNLPQPSDLMMTLQGGFTTPGKKE
jgi:hypothetical protein